jgi:Fe/S biogenesis protein NfuA
MFLAPAAPRGNVMDLENVQPEGEPKISLEVLPAATEKLLSVMASQEPPVDAVRVIAQGRGKYSMNLEPDGEPDIYDKVLLYDGFRVFVDPQSAFFLDGATLDYVETESGAGFKFTNPKDTPPERRSAPPEGPEGEIWRQIESILEEEINPAVAMHGGHVSLIDLKGSTLYIEMGGGCQGCGMANVTLKHGIEAVIRDKVPQIEEILDVTDHAGGRNPYYAPASK